MRSRAAGQQPAADGGAVAILTAMLALVLFGFAALAVELGDMYSRDAAVQTTADLAAFAGAQGLPDACKAFNKAREYLTSDKNGVFSDTAPTTFSASGLSDGDDTNGEIEILDWDNKPLPNPAGSPCSRAGHRVRVTTPKRTITFPLVAGLPGAPGSATVQGIAAVDVRSLDQLSVLPFSIPDTCDPGPQVIYTRDGIPPPPSGTPDYNPPGSRRGPWVVDVSPPNNDQTPVPVTIDVSLTRLRVDPGLPGPAVQFDFTLFGAATPVPAVDGTWIAGSTTPNLANAAWFDATFTVALPATVQNTPGLWRVRGSQPTPGTNRYTRDSRVGTFTVVPLKPAKCAPTGGVYGLLASPRSDGGNATTQQAKNFILGIDHDLFPVVSPNQNTPCDTNGVPYLDGRLDTLPLSTGATCVDVRPVDVSAAPPTNGLINGVGALGGRLVGPRPTVTPSSACNVDRDPDFWWTTSIRPSLVDTALSCYLAPGRDLTDVQDGDANSLTPAILKDPRFFVIPTTDTTAHPSNESGPQYWPIQGFVGAFLTNETAPGGDAKCASDSDCNGLVFGGGGQLDSVQAFTFPLSALQDTPTHPGNGRAYIGGPTDWVMVE